MFFLFPSLPIPLYVCLSYSLADCECLFQSFFLSFFKQINLHFIFVFFL